MRAKELIPAFLDVTGLPPDGVKMADRTLAEAGLRSKGRGPKPPDVTTEDVLRLLLAVTGAPVASKADKYVMDVSRFRCVPHPTTDWSAVKEWLGLSEDDVRGLPLLEVLAKVCAHLAGVPASPLPYIGLQIDVNGPVCIQCDGHNGTAFELQFTGALDYLGYPGVQRLARVHGSVLRWIGQNTED